MMRDYGQVAVLMGGKSAEREISLQSGAAVLAALQRNSVNAVAVDVDEMIADELRAKKIDRAFIALHGRGGEDGTVQGMLEMMEIPYTGSGVLASALGMDKLRTKQLWSGNGLPTPAYLSGNKCPDKTVFDQKLSLPVMVKPAHEGSSIGMSVVKSWDDLPKAWATAAKYDDSVYAEQFIAGEEYTVGVLNNEALPLIKLKTPQEFYDYEAKYVLNTTEYICPCGLPAEQEQVLQTLAIDAFYQVGASGWGRVDLMLDEKQQPWLIEINTVPGLTDHSLVPMAAKQAGISFDELVLKILDTSFDCANVKADS